jgi:hypothetical protein
MWLYGSGCKSEARSLGCALLRAFKTQGLMTKVGGVLFLEAFPLLGQVVAAEDRRNRANGYAGAAVDALDRVDEELIVGVRTGLVSLGVDTVYRTSVHTSPVFGADTGFRDYICHLKFSLVML